MPEFDPFQPINAEEFKPTDFPKDKAEETVDPKDVGVDNDLNLGDIESVPEDGEDADMSLDDFESEVGKSPESELPGATPELPQPLDVQAEPEKQVKWTVVPTDDNEIKSKHVGGFELRAKPLSSRQGEKVKYVVQLYKGEKIIDKGVTWVDAGIDPRTFLQNVSDRVLNKLGLTSNEIESQKPVETPEAGSEGAPAAEVPGAAEGAEAGTEGTSEDTPEGAPEGGEDLAGPEDAKGGNDEFNKDMDEILGSI
jgi:hypothetical protein